MSYEDVSFDGPSRSEYTSLSTGHARSGGSGIVDIYVKLEDGKVYRLRELPEEVAAGLSKELTAGRTSVGEGPGTYYLGTNTILQYQGGELYYVILAGEDISVSGSADGPFLSFPLTARQIRDLFGEPDREGTAPVSRFRFN